MTATSEPLSGTDNFWLRAGEPANLMQINAILALDGPLDGERVRRLLSERLLRFRRFRQRIVVRRPGARGRWEPDPDFDLNRHFLHQRLPEPADRGLLRELVGELMATPLPAGRPPWQIHLIADCEGDAVLVCRFHHSLADGFALLHVMLSLTAGDAESLPSSSVAGRHRPLGLWRRIARLGPALAHLLRLDSESGTLLRQPLGVAKRVAWSRPFAVADVKATGAAAGATINDVLMAALTGALRHYLEERGEDAGARHLRAVVPVNLRLDRDPNELGNDLGLVFLELPIGEASPGGRLRAVKARMDRLKRSAEAFIVAFLLRVAGRASAGVQRLLLRYFASKVTLVVTNVPGPRKRRTLAGQKIRSILFWVPQSSSVGLGISIISYAGEVRIGVASDAGIVPEPQRLADLFERELLESSPPTGEAGTRGADRHLESRRRLR